jgi:hypothetical protein
MLFDCVLAPPDTKHQTSSVSSESRATHFSRGLEPAQDAATHLREVRLNAEGCAAASPRARRPATARSSSAHARAPRRESRAAATQAAGRAKEGEGQVAGTRAEQRGRERGARQQHCVGCGPRALLQPAGCRAAARALQGAGERAECGCSAPGLSACGPAGQVQQQERQST